MKKGQKVRVLADNRVGIVADSHFINWGGKRLVQHQVKFPNTKGEAPWFPAEQLTTDLVEKATVVVKGDKGVISFIYSVDHDNHGAELEMSGDFPVNGDTIGLHAELAAALVSGLQQNFGVPFSLSLIL